jgi:hypothetical protein
MFCRLRGADGPARRADAGRRGADRMVGRTVAARRVAGVCGCCAAGARSAGLTSTARPPAPVRRPGRFGRLPTKITSGGYDPGIKDARLPASLTTVGRAFRWKPCTYGQAWLLAVLVAVLAALIGFSLPGAHNGWGLYWPGFAVGYPVLLVVQGLGLATTCTGDVSVPAACRLRVDSARLGGPMLAREMRAPEDGIVMVRGRGFAVSDAGPGSGPSGQSRVCAGGAHGDCGHTNAVVRLPASGRRLVSSVALCRCACHAACPLAGRMPVSLRVWQQLCICPGAGRQRAATEDQDEPWPDAGEYREKEQRKSRESREGRRQAVRAAREAAPGKTRDEVRDLYVAELRARGQEVPAGPFLEAEVDVLMGDPLGGLRKVWKVVRSPFSGL